MDEVFPLCFFIENENDCDSFSYFIPNLMSSLKRLSFISSE